MFTGTMKNAIELVSRQAWVLLDRVEYEFTSINAGSAEVGIVYGEVVGTLARYER